ncbi:AraC family transcriptional regulator [Bradyrhizobium arachidis]|uniref:helix-turn-helix transcriptional regulator n=1 Tax=Bradyrhizobium TaxID=374 RepID=UPI002163053A|nr:AraC family transcriptional regulator [Bradyrhizobium arachidis]
MLTGDVVPLAEGPVRCDVTALPLPSVKMSGASGTPMSFVATGTDPDNALGFVLASHAPMRIAVDDRALDLAPMEVGLADAAHVGAHVSQLSEGSFRGLLINRKALLELCPHAEDLIARPLNANAGVKMLLQGYCDLLIENANSLDALARNAAAQHLIDLVALSLGTGRDETELVKDRGLAAARLEAIKADVLARLGNGDLSLAEVAQRNRASPRYVQMLFERTGTTFSEFVLEQRLIRAARLLRGSLQRSRKVSDIAHLAGFNDVSYFHRAFRRRFGMTPSDMRSGMPRGDDASRS